MDLPLAVVNRTSWALAVMAGALAILGFWVRDNMSVRVSVAVFAFAVLAAWQALRLRALGRKIRFGSGGPGESR